MSHYRLYQALFVLTGLFALADLVAIIKRRLHRHVPWFTVYLIAVVVQEIVCGIVYTIDTRDDAYTYFYYFVGWAFQAAMLLLGSLLIVEGMRNSLADYASVRRWGRNICIAIGILTVLVALWSLPYGAQDTFRYMRLTLVAMRSVRMVQLGVLVAFFAFASYLSLSWRSHDFGILMGFGLYVAISLACNAFVAYQGQAVAFTTMVVESTGYLLVLLLWFTYIYREKPQQAPILPPSAGSELEEWNRALEQAPR